MNADISAKLNEILSDPEKLSAVMGAVSGVMGQASEQKGEAKGEDVTPKIPNIPNIPLSLPSDDRIRLLEAIKPFVASEKQAKVDKLIRMMTLGSLAGTFKNFL